MIPTGKTSSRKARKRAVVTAGTALEAARGAEKTTSVGRCRARLPLGPCRRGRGDSRRSSASARQIGAYFSCFRIGYHSARAVTRRTLRWALSPVVCTPPATRCDTLWQQGPTGESLDFVRHTFFFVCSVCVMEMHRGRCTC